jgi:hypothetical protein
MHNKDNIYNTAGTFYPCVGLTKLKFSLNTLTDELYTFLILLGSYCKFSATLFLVYFFVYFFELCV